MFLLVPADNNIITRDPVMETKNIRGEHGNSIRKKKGGGGKNGTKIETI